MTVSMTEWHPDEALAESVMGGRRKYGELSHDDRRWVVADLSQRGHSVKRIAGWLGCSERQVKRLRAELATQVMGAYLGERRRRAEVARVAQHAQREVRELRDDLEALRAVVDPRVSDAMCRAARWLESSE